MSDSERQVPGARGIEVWLRSPLRRALLIVAVTLVVSVVTTFQLWELYTEANQRREEFGGPALQPFDAFAVWRHQLITWGIWALAAEPIWWVSRLLDRLLGHWALVVLLQLPISYAAAHGTVDLDNRVTRALFSDGEPLERMLPPGPGPRRRPGLAEGERFGPPAEEDLDGPPPRDDRPGSRFGAGRRPRGLGALIRSRRLRVPRDMGTYWAILALGAWMTATLRSRTQERLAERTRLDSANLEARLARAQMASLESQLHPHFLFNSLHAVGGLIRANEGPTALRTLSALGGLLRRTLDLGESQRIPLREELETAELYLSIEEIRFGERLVTVVDAADEALDALVPALLLLPLVENAVRYAVEPRVEGGRIEIDAAVEGERLVLEVRDDGPGFPADVLAGREPDDGRAHIGLTNCRKRLAMLYGESHRFEPSTDASGGACIRIELPLETRGAEDTE